MRKNTAAFLAALLTLQPVWAAAQIKLPAEFLLNRAFDGSDEKPQRYTNGTERYRTESVLTKGGRRMPARAVKVDPEDEFGVSWRWFPGEIYDDYTVTRYFRIYNKEIYAKDKASNATVGSGLGMGILAALIGVGSGIGSGFAARLIFKWGIRGSAGLGILAGAAAGLGFGIPMVRASSMSAYNAAYKAALQDPETWETKEFITKLVAYFDHQPPLNSPAHPEKLAEAKEKKAQAERRARGEKESAPRD